MQIEFYPSKAEGIIKAPKSKSYLHRLLISSALSDGESKISGFEECEDVLSTLDSLKKLGAEIEISGNIATVKGISQHSATENAVLPCRSSASTLRFLIPIVSALGKRAVFTGTERLFERPLEIYENIFKEQNIFCKPDKTSLTLCGNLSAGNFALRGDISSQFISGLMFALPLLKSDSTITVTTPIESASYINLTMDVLSSFGIKIERKDNTFFIKGNQKYIPHNCEVEGDYSNAAFFDALNFFGGKVEISGLNENSLQGDKIYKSHFETLQNKTPVIDISDCPDLAPILISVASVKNGAVLTGTKRLSFKESDRANAMKAELEKMGGNITVGDNFVEIKKSILHAPSTPVCSHGDHRIAMALSILLTVTGGILKDAEAVNKSFPAFYEKLSRLGIKFNTL